MEEGPREKLGRKKEKKEEKEKLGRDAGTKEQRSCRRDRRSRTLSKNKLVFCDGKCWRVLNVCRIGRYLSKNLLTIHTWKTKLLPASPTIQAFRISCSKNVRSIANTRSDINQRRSVTDSNSGNILSRLGCSCVILRMKSDSEETSSKLIPTISTAEELSS